MITVKVLVLLTSIFILNENLVITNAFRVFDFDGRETILASENENIIIQCKADFPMTYCGFVHPSGKRLSFTDRAVNDGKCVQKIRATRADNGEWGCHIGRKSVRLETIKKIEVRIVNEIAAIEPNITGRLERPVTLACATTKGLIPLSYCRFEPPSGRSFNIDSTVTKTTPILGKYYFPSNASLDRGDCAVTINKIKYEDIGLWTCGASLDDGKEHIDVINLEVEGMYKMSTASTTGVTLGAILIAVVLGSLGYIVWKNRRFLGGSSDVPETAEQEAVELREIARPTSVSPGQQERIPTIVIQSPSTPGDPSSSPTTPECPSSI